MQRPRTSSVMNWITINLGHVTSGSDGYKPASFEQYVADRVALREHLLVADVELRDLAAALELAARAHFFHLVEGDLCEEDAAVVRNAIAFHAESYAFIGEFDASDCQR